MNDYNKILDYLQSLAPDVDVKALVKNIMHIEGNNNIVIQGVNGSTITVNQHIHDVSKDTLLAIIKELQKPNKQLNHIPKIAVPKVVGRENDVKKVRSLLIEKNALVIVNGLGGMGKTVLAHYYWKEYEAEYTHLLWLNGENELESELLNNSLLHLNLQITEKIAPYLAAIKSTDNAEARQQALDLIQYTLTALDKPCLMMIDNADEAHFRAIKKWAVNLTNFHVLITSRDKMTDVHTHLLGGVSKPDALDLFYLYYDLGGEKPHNDTLVAEICEIAGYHTLTIELLAKTLSDHGRLNFESLLAELKKHLVYLDRKTRVVTNYTEKKAHIDSILELCFSLAHIADNAAACDLLLCFSVLPTYDVKAIHLEEMLGVTDENETEYLDALTTLVQKGWIQETYATTNLYHSHAVIQEIVRKKLNANAENCDKIIQFLIDKVYDINNINPLHAAEWLPYADSILQKLPDETSKIATLANNIATTYQAMGDLPQSLYYGLKDLAICEKIFAADHPSLATTYGNIALTYKAMGDLPQSLHYGLKDLAICEKIFAADHPSLATTYGNIALTYKAMGDLPQSLEYGLKALTVFEKILAADHPDLATTYNNIALTYEAMGDLPQSLEYGLKALTIFEKVLAADHPSLATAYNNIAITYKAMGDLPQSLEYGLKALTIREKIFAADHPSLATAYNNIAGTYEAMGDLPKSLHYGLKALTIFEKIFAADHPSLATAYNNIALTYKAMGDLPKSLHYGLKDLAISEKILAADHPNLATTYNNIAATYKAMGDLPQSLHYGLKALMIFEKVLAADHPSLATAYNNIAATYKAMGDLPQSLEYGLKALTIFEKVLAADHPFLATAYNNIAATYEAMGDLPKSLEYGLKTVTIFEKILAADHPSLATAYHNIAVTYYYLLDWEQAILYEQKALIINLKILPFGHYNIKKSVDTMAAMLGKAVEEKGEAWAMPYIQWYVINCRAYLKK